MSNGNHVKLLNRLKKINIARKVVKVNTVNPEENIGDELRNLKHDKLEKIIELHISDPLIWDNYTLSRIYKIPDSHLTTITRYVKPMVHYTGWDVDTTKIVKTSFVFDVSRFKRDKGYYPLFQKLVFPQNPEVPLAVE